MSDQTLQVLWPWIVGAAAVIVALATASHVILNKRDVRAAIGWTGLILFNPFLGAIAYYFLGINRIQRRAARIVSGRLEQSDPAGAPPHATPDEVAGQHGESFGLLARMIGEATGRALLRGNSVVPLVNGDQTYPAMLEAIRTARRSVAMESYILDNDHAGRMFVDAFADAVRRGVEVRVLVDAVGGRYSRPRITRVLRRAGVRAAEFLPTRIPWRNAYMNLRSHRKILVVDGRDGFVGGMNVRERCLLERSPRHPTRDLHFQVGGPITERLFAALAQDWLFTTGERLEGPAWECGTRNAGPVIARGIPDGPDEDFETIRWAMLAALDVARSSVRILTPYFLPDSALIAALNLAAMRGVTVDVVLPRVNNLRFVQWASSAQLGQVLQAGCRVWLTEGPFDHSKVMVMDGRWSLIGSANWDPRSLRLNFEYNVECYDAELAGKLLHITDDKLRGAQRVTLADVDARSLPVRLRDGVARLFSPYL